MKTNPIIYFLISVCLTNIQPNSNLPILPKETNNLSYISQENLSLEKTFSMKSYFQHLYKNLPENALGSYAFISLISCLSYYDSYYIDTIINDKFDRESNGASIEDVVSTSPGVNFSKVPSNFISNKKTLEIL